jgi:uncharacterized membrane protein YeiB
VEYDATSVSTSSVTAGNTRSLRPEAGSTVFTTASTRAGSTELNRDFSLRMISAARRMAAKEMSGVPWLMLFASELARSGEFFVAMDRKQRWRFSRRAEGRAVLEMRIREAMAEYASSSFSKGVQE